MRSAKKLALLFLGLVTLLYPSVSFTADKDDAPKVEIEKFRFSRKNKGGLERLVLQFKGAEKLKRKPSVKVATEAASKESSITVDGTTLTGAIPEAMINESYTPRSRYFGPVAISTDEMASGFNIRVTLKENIYSVKSFWLEKPARLVIDLFATSSAERAGAGGGRKLASTPEEPGAAALKGLKNNILCFPSESQVSAAVLFSPKKGNTAPLPDPANRIAPPTNVVVGAEKTQADSIICFHASSLLSVGVTFIPKNPMALPPPEGDAAPVGLEDPNRLPSADPNAAPANGAAAMPPAAMDAAAALPPAAPPAPATK